MSLDLTPRGAIDIGHVISTLFGVLGRNLLVFLVLALILTGLPTAVAGYLQLEFTRSTVSLPNIWPFVLSGLVSLVTGMTLQGALVHATVTDLNGKRATIGDSLAVGLRAFLPLIAIAILFGLAVAAGMVLLIVPGIMLAIAWAVVAPVYVAEGRGMFDSFGRSADLTRNNRWRIFALALLNLVLLIVVGAILGGIVGVISLASGGQNLVLTAVVLNPLSQVISAVIGATGAAVLYVELRKAKEGLGIDALAALFD